MRVEQASSYSYLVSCIAGRPFAKNEPRLRVVVFDCTPVTGNQATLEEGQLEWVVAGYPALSVVCDKG